MPLAYIILSIGNINKKRTVIPMKVDGEDVKYLLRKKGYTFIDVARQLGYSCNHVRCVAFGLRPSPRVVEHIETLLGMQPGELEITRERRDELVQVA